MRPLAERFFPVIAFALVALASFAAGFIEPRQIAHEPVVTAMPVPPPIQLNPERKEWREEQDLAAQWDQARWGQAAALAGFLSVLVTGIGIIFVRATLDATRHATAAALKSSAIAQDQAAAAIENSTLNRMAYVAEQRPWLKLDLVPQRVRLDDEGLHVRVKCKLTNLGRTPATRAWTEPMLYVMAPGVESEFHPARLQSDCIIAAKNKPIEQFGSLVFPGASIEQIVGATIPRDRLLLATQFVKGFEPLITAVTTYGSNFEDSSYCTAMQCTLRCARTGPRRIQSAERKRSPTSIYLDETSLKELTFELVLSPIVPGYAD